MGISDLRGSIETISLGELISLLRKRFEASQRIDVTLSRFISTGIPNSWEEFSTLLKDGTIIYEKKLMQEAALFQMIVNKSPIEIKGLLYQTALGAKSWDEFMQKAEEDAWIAFPDKMLLRVENHQSAVKT